MMMNVVFVVVIISIALQSAVAQVSEACPTYDASKIRLVTFDTFAALMDLETSMLQNVADVLPELTSSQVNSLVNQWINSYGQAMNTVFDEGATGTYAFNYLISTSLKQILASMNLTVSRDEFDALVRSWGKLTPWADTQKTLETIINANFTIAPLSNGDSATLTSAMTVFKKPVEFTYVFSSDFPVGAFKPQAAMYTQTLKQHYAIHEVLHVAGSRVDGAGARDAGFFSALLHNQPKDTDTEPCFVLSDITGVPAILGIESASAPCS